MKKFIISMIKLCIASIIIGLVFAFTFDHLQLRHNKNSLEDSKVVIQKNDSDIKVHSTSEIDRSGINKAMNAVFPINVSVNYFGYGLRPYSTGSSVLYKEDDNYYYFITNAHVIKNNDQVDINIDDKDYKVDVLGLDIDTDLAVLRLNKSSEYSLEPIEIANIDDVRILDQVVAIGNALGYGQTLTTGVVSALDRSISKQSDFAYKLIQTDTAINPGNSGGALVDSRGRIIGINSSKISISSNTIIEGVGFAIPINAAVKISDSIIENGYLPRTYLGIYMKMTDVEDDQTQVRGVRVYEVVENSGAQKAGIQRGDIILSYDNNKVVDILEFNNYIKQKKPGDIIELEILRGQNIININVELSKTEKTN